MPLNGKLYSQLCRLFKNRVTIRNPGQPMRCSYSPWIDRLGRVQPRLRLNVIDPGEEYVTCCPFCGDTRDRLTVNHRLGVWDQKTQSYNKFLFHCFNESCEEDKDNRVQFYEMACTHAGASIRRTDPIEYQQADSATAQRELTEVDWPGDVIQLDELAQQDPEHHALDYLRDRRFDPVHLGRRYHLSYCTYSSYSMARGRIIIPFHMEDKLVGWQARYVGTPDDRTPRYWSCPGMPRSLVAYGFDEAVQYPTIVLVEGPFDRLRVGPCAIALLGKTMSQPLRRLLKKRARKDARVVVMLDPNQDAESERRGRLHHIQQLIEQLRPLFRGRLLPVWLPEDSDPGSLSRTAIFRCIRDHAREKNMQIALPKPRARKNNPTND